MPDSRKFQRPRTTWRVWVVMRPFRGNRWSSQMSVFIPVCVHGAVRPCKGSSERTRRSRAFPHGRAQASGRGGNLGWVCLGEENQPALGSAGSGLEWGCITGRPAWATLSLDRELALESPSTDGSTDWPQREGDGTCSSLSTAFHLGRDQDPQRARAGPGAVAGGWQEGLWCQPVFQETSRGQPGYQPLRRAGCHGKSGESSGGRWFQRQGRRTWWGILSGGGHHCAWLERGLRKQHDDLGLQDIRKSPTNIFDRRSSRDSCKNLWSRGFI